MALLSGSTVLAAAIVAVVLLNAAVAFVQERHAEHAVEALSAYLPPQATVVRDRVQHSIAVRELVSGDLILISEGNRIPADARLLSGYVEVDLSMLTGESVSVPRSAGEEPDTGPLLSARDLVFSGTTCTAGAARAIVVSTGMRTEIGRVAALTERVSREESPLERQVRRVAWLIAAVAVGVGLAFLPLGVLAGLPVNEALVFAIGLLVANVPEGLLPTITLALAVGVRVLARSGAVVRRLSAVETLGSTTVICTDKTGTLTENRMRPVRLWTAADDRPVSVPPGAGTRSDGSAGGSSPATGPAAMPASVSGPLGTALAACSNADLGRPERGRDTHGDPTEIGLLHAARWLGRAVRPAAGGGALRLPRAPDVDRRRGRARPPRRVRQRRPGSGSRALREPADARGIPPADRDGFTRQLAEFAADGLRVLPVADRELPGGHPALGGGQPGRVDRDALETDLRLLGIVGLADPPRSGTAEAVAACHRAGIRINVVSGDHALTTAAVARQVGIGGPGTAGLQVVSTEDLGDPAEADLDAFLRDDREIVFARSSPETKLRITDALHTRGEVVAMTGDGVNDAPALRRADIGVAMGRSGTDVAREASTMVLTDDDFATIVRAVEAGRQVYDNVRKFIVYIFAHAIPEIVPFLVFALSGGTVPLTVLQILMIDLGTETLPALALGREPAEPGLMERPPRPRGEGVIRPVMLLRAWGVLGLVSAAAVMAVYFTVLWRIGWHPGDSVDKGTPLHEGYQRATTMTFLAIVACQIGTATAARTEHTSLFAVGLFTNRLLLAGIAFEIAFAAVVVYVPALQHILGTAAVPPSDLLLLLPLPVLVWGADELWRAWRRRAATIPGEPVGDSR
nr:cation-transporting P-type ATPase [Candidatus Frankia alpina]